MTISNTDFLADYKLEGEKLKIITFPDPVLKKKALPVVTFNEDLALLAKNMLYTMYHAPGVGLAAPQVNKSIRMFVIDVDFDREKITNADDSITYNLSNFSPRVFINPEIIKKEGELIYEEGCLSVPGIYEKVNRFEKIQVKYFDLFGKEQFLDAEGLLSVCIQHETDHLDGIVFIEKLSMLKKTMITKKLIKEKKSKSFIKSEEDDPDFI